MKVKKRSDEKHKKKRRIRKKCEKIINPTFYQKLRKQNITKICVIRMVVKHTKKEPK